MHLLAGAQCLLEQEILVIYTIVLSSWTGSFEKTTLPVMFILIFKSLVMHQGLFVCDWIHYL